MLRSNIYIFLLSALFQYNTPSESQITPEDVSEGPCLEPTPEVPTGVNYAWLFAPGTPMFIPMGSQHMYRSYAQYLIGRPPLDETELEQMELKINYFGPFVKNIGFDDQHVRQFCFPFDYLRPNIADMTCRSTTGSAKANTTLISLTHDTLVWTDNKSALLFVRCSRGQKDFKVLSPFPTITKPVVKKIMETIKSLGFSERHVQFLPYTTAKAA